MCDCIKEVENKVLNSLKEKNPNNSYSEVSTFIKVNGERSKPRKETITITQNYCCFCGIKLIKE